MKTEVPQTVESLLMIQQMFFVSYLNNKQHQMLKLTLLMGTHSITYFMALFEEAVERKIDDSKGQLTRLIKFTRGEAKELIQHCIQLPDSVGCKQAISLMERCYGNQHTIVVAYRSRAQQIQYLHALIFVHVK